jgi:hypothetical protein
MPPRLDEIDMWWNQSGSVGGSPMKLTLHRRKRTFSTPRLSSVRQTGEPETP